MTEPAARGRPRRILFVFIDGVGIGSSDPSVNPLAAAHFPALVDLARGPLHRGPDGVLPRVMSSHAACLPLDANLGLEGRPQSGTGQTSLLSGINAAACFGRHFGPWVPTPLRSDFSRRNLLSAAALGGRKVRYANAVPGQGPAAGSERRPAAPPFAARAAGARIRDVRDLAAGNAVASQITQEIWRRHAGGEVPDISAAEAGGRLAALAAGADVTLFAHFDTDHAGHRREMAAAVAVLRRLDSFLGAVRRSLPADTLLVVTSDHGNLEDLRTGHTRNPVPFLASGPGAGRLSGSLDSITDVTPGLLALLGISRPV